MDLILATQDGREEKYLDYDYDMEIGKDNTFELSMSYPDFDKALQFEKLIYEPGTECGGIIKDIEGATNTDKIYIRGYTWRGYLVHRIIEPPAGSDYRTVSGELNSVIAGILGDTLGPLFQVSAVSTGVSVSNYRFDRYCTVEAGLMKMLATKGYRLQISYVQRESDGYVLVEAVPAVNYSDDIELSQDAQLNFTSRDNRMGVNHLICLGTGELQERAVVHLYADESGNISQTKTISGINEIVETFENTTAETEQLTKDGTEKFKSLLSYKNFTASASAISGDLQIGDTITGRDYITGNVVTKPVSRKILKRVNGAETVNYKIEGES